MQVNRFAQNAAALFRPHGKHPLKQASIVASPKIAISLDNSRAYI